MQDENKQHDSDCSTNNSGCPELLGECDCKINVRNVIESQKNDGALWFNAMTAPEAYLQQELKRLHDAISVAQCF